MPILSDSGRTAGGRSRSGPLGGEIARRIEQLAQCSEEQGRLTRPYLSAAHRRAADLTLAWMREAGMTARLDAIGNVRGVYRADAADAPTLLVGSHIDTVRDAGPFDGNLGVVLAISAVRRLHDAGRRLPYAIEVIGFGDEEGLRFATTLTGSRAVAGRFDPSVLEEKDKDGVSRRDALTAFGCDVGAIHRERCDPRTALAYVEVHIEQGPVLEAQGLPVGIVTGINGARRGWIVVEGAAAHAGTTPMALRQDALAAAAEMISAVERVGRDTPDLVATVGRLDVHPGAVNTVPGRVVFSLDVRSPRDPERDAAVTVVRSEIARIARTRGVAAEVTLDHAADASPCDRRVIEALARSVSCHGVRPHFLPSGAGHDAMAFHGIVPFGMLFVRSRGGVSHHAGEFTAEDDIDLAAEVLVDFLETLDRTGFAGDREPPITPESQT